MSIFQLASILFLTTKRYLGLLPNQDKLMESTLYPSSDTRKRSPKSLWFRNSGLQLKALPYNFRQEWQRTKITKKMPRDSCFRKQVVLFLLFRRFLAQLLITIPGKVMRQVRYSLPILMETPVKASNNKTWNRHNA